MTIWYKCSHCEFYIYFFDSLKSHLKSIHKESINLEGAKEFIVNDQDKIDHLKKVYSTN